MMKMAPSHLSVERGLRVLILTSVIALQCVVSVPHVLGHVCTSGSHAGVGRPELCRRGSDVKIVASRMYLMTHAGHRAQCCGQVSGWRFQASARAMIRPIDFLVWRPLTPAGQGYRLIGSHADWYLKGASRSISVEMEEDDYIDVEPGDVIGWHTPLGDVVDYRPAKVNDPEGMSIAIVDGADAVVRKGQEVILTGSRREERVYGLRAVLEPVRPPAFVEMSSRVTLECPLNSGSFITKVKVINEINVNDGSSNNLKYDNNRNSSIRNNNNNNNDPSVTFDIEGFNPWFKINPITGVIETKSRIHGNLTNEIVVVAMVTKCRLASHRVITVQCIDVSTSTRVSTGQRRRKTMDEAPSVSAPKLVTVAEDTPGGTLVFTTTATSASLDDDDDDDDDDGDEYGDDDDTDDDDNEDDSENQRDPTSNDKTIISVACIDDVCQGLFDFQYDKNQGHVFLKKNASLNYETQPRFHFVIHAKRSSYYSPPIYVIINVTDVNEPPRALKRTLEISSHAKKKGDTVSNINFQDFFSDPEGDPIVFGVDIKNRHRPRGGGEGNESEVLPFSLSFQSNVMVLDGDIALHKSRFPLAVDVTVTATDVQGLTGQMEVLIIFVHVNSAPILLNLPTHLLLTEGFFEPGQEIFKVDVTDEDVEDEVILAYQVEEGNDTGAILSLNSLDGKVTFDFLPAMPGGSTLTVAMEISAFDGNLTSGRGVLKVTLLGVNDPPHFNVSLIDVSISEEETTESPFLNLHSYVLDPDPDDIVTFRVTGGQGHELLNVSAGTGEVKLNSDYDIDIPGVINSLDVIIIVSDKDGLSDKADLRIRVIDLNDNIPVVSNDGETFYVKPPIYSGLKIGQVVATDSDSEMNGELTFELVGSSLNDTTRFFSISPEGWLTSSGKFPPLNSVTVYIAVSDRGVPANVAMATVDIVIERPNDTALLFKQNGGGGGGGEGGGDENEMDDKDNGGDGRNLSATLILIALVAVSFGVILILGYQLWKTKKRIRSLGDSDHHNAYHEYRFPWICNRITDDDTTNGLDREIESPLSSHAAPPSSLGSCVYNPNYSHHPPHQQQQNQHHQQHEQQQHHHYHNNQNTGYIMPSSSCANDIVPSQCSKVNNNASAQGFPSECNIINVPRLARTRNDNQAKSNNDVLSENGHDKFPSKCDGEDSCDSLWSNCNDHIFPNHQGRRKRERGQVLFNVENTNVQYPFSTRPDHDVENTNVQYPSRNNAALKLKEDDKNTRGSVADATHTLGDIPGQVMPFYCHSDGHGNGSGNNEDGDESTTKF